MRAYAAVLAALAVPACLGFTVAPRSSRVTMARFMAEEGATAEVEAPKPAQPEIPELKSEVGYDHMPLAEALKDQDFLTADQITRDSLIQLAGEGAKDRNYVYFTEVYDIPGADLATMERLWLLYSKGKFGYTVQKRIWKLQKGSFDNFCRKIGWNTKDGEIERKLKWFGANEFIYDLEKAPKGHLPLTAALRGTPLLERLISHPVWETEWNPEEKN